MTRHFAVALVLYVLAELATMRLLADAGSVRLVVQACLTVVYAAFLFALARHPT
jgi:hypothetical protein